MRRLLFLITFLSLSTSIFAQKNKIGVTINPTVLQHSIFMMYEHRIHNSWAIGVDIGTNHTPIKGDKLYRSNVDFDTWLTTFNPWVGFYFRPDGKTAEDLMIPKMVMIKSSTLFLQPVNGDLEVIDAYEIMLGNVMQLNRWFVKIDYGFKHITSRREIKHGSETTLFPKRRLAPSIAIYTGIRF